LSAKRNERRAFFITACVFYYGVRFLLRRAFFITACAFFYGVRFLLRRAFFITACAFFYGVRFLLRRAARSSELNKIYLMASEVHKRACI
jgi:hypothetical protein